MLDLLGLDPHPLANGSSKLLAATGANGDATSTEEGGSSRALMLTELAVAPSMLGPVGAARGAASEMSALMAEVRGLYVECFDGVVLARGDRTLPVYTARKESYRVAPETPFPGPLSSYGSS